ncbi:unnamed protein product, partial [Polarella glacialis]
MTARSFAQERQQWESQATRRTGKLMFIRWYLYQQQWEFSLMFTCAVVADAPARQKDIDDGDAESVSPNVRAGAFRGTATEADSTTGLWNSEETEERRRRRRRRRAADTAGGNGATWRTTTTATEREQKRSWRDPQADSLTMNADDTLTTVVEGGRETKREAKEARRRRRIRRVDSTVADSQAGAEPW